MADQRRAIIGVVDAHTRSLIGSIIVTPVFKAHLIEKNVFTQEVVENIFRRCWTESEQLEEMVRCLRKRIEESGCEVMNQFLTCLRDTGHKNVSQTLYDRMREAAIEVGGMQEIGR